MIRSFYLGIRKMGLGHVPKHKVHARSRRLKAWHNHSDRVSLTIRDPIPACVCRVLPTQLRLQSTLISILAPLLTSAGEGSVPLRLNVAITS